MSLSPDFSAPEEVRAAAASAGLGQTPEIWDAFADFLAQVAKVSETMNLVGNPSLETLWNRHLLDSLTLLPHLPEGSQLADIGSGGGFPAIPIAMARPDLRITCIESISKKARFIESCAEGLNLETAALRAEEVGRNPAFRESFDLVTGRAVTALNRFLELTVPLAKPDGRILAMKGERTGSEIEEAARALAELKAEVVAVHPAWPGDDALVRGSIIEIRKLEPTPDRYPRSTQQISKRAIA